MEVGIQHVRERELAKVRCYFFFGKKLTSA